MISFRTTSILEEKFKKNTLLERGRLINKEIKKFSDEHNKFLKDLSDISEKIGENIPYTIAIINILFPNDDLFSATAKMKEKIKNANIIADDNIKTKNIRAEKEIEKNKLKNLLGKTFYLKIILNL